MTNREAYVFGWVFGRLVKAAEEQSKEIDGGIIEPATRPYSANARIIFNAHTEKILTKELDMQIGEALCEIKNVSPPMENGSEKVQPIGIRGQWFFGYYAGLGEHPLAEETFDIAAARKAKKMTQEQLADAMGVYQAVISRWESGRVSPNKENLKKLKEILA